MFLHRLFLEAVAHAANGFDVAARLAELPAETDHLDVDGPIGDGVIVAVDAVEDLLPRENPPRPLGQEADQLEFRGRQIDPIAVDEDLMPPGVDLQVPDFDDFVLPILILFAFDGGVFGFGAAQDGLLFGPAAPWG